MLSRILSHEFVSRLPAVLLIAEPAYAQLVIDDSVSLFFI
jgi:hypothetical protein